MLLVECPKCGGLVQRAHDSQAEFEGPIGDAACVVLPGVRTISKSICADGKVLERILMSRVCRACSSQDAELDRKMRNGGHCYP